MAALGHAPWRADKLGVDSWPGAAGGVVAPAGYEPRSTGQFTGTKYFAPRESAGGAARSSFFPDGDDDDDASDRGPGDGFRASLPLERERPSFVDHLTHWSDPARNVATGAHPLGPTLTATGAPNGRASAMTTALDRHPLKIRFPAVRSVLWDSTPRGPPVVAWWHMRKHVLALRVGVVERIRDALQRGGARAGSGADRGRNTWVARLRFEPQLALVDGRDGACGRQGPGFVVDGLDPPGTGAGIPGTAPCVLFDRERGADGEAAVMSTAFPTTSEYISLVGAVERRSQSHNHVDEGALSALHLSAYLLRDDTVVLHTERLAPAFELAFRPVRSLSLLGTPLAHTLRDPSASPGKLETGYLTMDQVRRVVPLLETDHMASDFPLVGIWVNIRDPAYRPPDPSDVGCAGIRADGGELGSAARAAGIADVAERGPHEPEQISLRALRDPHVWSACVRYIHATSIADRASPGEGAFLVAVFPPPSEGAIESSAPSPFPPTELTPAAPEMEPFFYECRVGTPPSDVGGGGAVLTTPSRVPVAHESATLRVTLPPPSTAGATRVTAVDLDRPASAPVPTSTYGVAEIAARGAGSVEVVFCPLGDTMLDVSDVDNTSLASVRSSRLRSAIESTTGEGFRSTDDADAATTETGPSGAKAQTFRVAEDVEEETPLPQRWAAPEPSPQREPRPQVAGVSGPGNRTESPTRIPAPAFRTVASPRRHVSSGVPTETATAAATEAPSDFTQSATPDMVLKAVLSLEPDKLKALVQPLLPAMYGELVALQQQQLSDLRQEVNRLRVELAQARRGGAAAETLHRAPKGSTGEAAAENAATVAAPLPPKSSAGDGPLVLHHDGGHSRPGDTVLDSADSFEWRRRALAAASTKRPSESGRPASGVSSDDSTDDDEVSRRAAAFIHRHRRAEAVRRSRDSQRTAAKRTAVDSDDEGESYSSGTSETNVSTDEEEDYFPISRHADQARLTAPFHDPVGNVAFDPLSARAALRSAEAVAGDSEARAPPAAATPHVVRPPRASTQNRDGERGAAPSPRDRPSTLPRAEQPHRAARDAEGRERPGSGSTSSTPREAPSRADAVRAAAAASGRRRIGRDRRVVSTPRSSRGTISSATVAAVLSGDAEAAAASLEAAGALGPAEATASPRSQASERRSGRTVADRSESKVDSIWGNDGELSGGSQTLAPPLRALQDPMGGGDRSGPDTPPSLASTADIPTIQFTPSDDEDAEESTVDRIEARYARRMRAASGSEESDSGSVGGMRELLEPPSVHRDPMK